MPIEFYTENESRYTLSDTGIVGKVIDGKPYCLGRGFYLDRKFIFDYTAEEAHFCFKDEKEKEGFIKEANLAKCNKLGGCVAFFNPKNPLKLEYSTKVVKSDPSLNGEANPASSGLKLIVDGDKEDKTK